MAGRASAPDDHANYVFGFGPAGDEARSEADVLLVAGSRLGNLDVPYDAYWGDPQGKRLIQIDIDPRHFGVTRPLALGILADARPALEGIATRLRAMQLPPREARDLARYRELDQEVKLRAGGRRSSNGRVRASTPRTRSGRSGRSSAPTPSTPSTAATRRCGRTRPAADAPALLPLDPRARHARHGHPRRRSAPSSARPSARSSASAATERRASTSWRCSPRHARASRSR